MKSGVSLNDVMCYVTSGRPKASHRWYVINYIIEQLVLNKTLQKL